MLPEYYSDLCKDALAPFGFVCCRTGSLDVSEICALLVHSSSVLSGTPYEVSAVLVYIYIYTCISSR